MKKLLSLVLLVSMTLAGFSQKVFFNKNALETTVKKLTTTNGTITTAATVTLTNNEVGVLTIKVIGFSADSVAAVTGVRSYRYTKVGGTLTLGTVIETQAIVADAKVTGATFSASASSNNVLVRVTGVADVVMYWDVIIIQRGTRRSY